MKNRSGQLSLYMLLLVVLVALAMMVYGGTPQTTVKYSEIVGYFERGEVTEYFLDLGTGELTMTLKGQEDNLTYRVPNVNLFINQVVNGIVADYAETHPGAGIVYDYKAAAETPWYIQMIPTFVMVLMLVGFMYFIVRQQNSGGAMSFGRVKVKNKPEEGRKVNFQDVAGADEEKDELEEIVEYLRAPRKFSELGARIPKGVLLVGPPGTGKTLLARAVAGEAGVPFFSISGSNFVEMFVGVGASRVRDLFEQAKKESPSIVFIDEIDAVGRHRGAGLGGGHDEREQTLNQLLVEMDGFDNNTGVIVMAATNRADILDPALLRPGRFDRQVFMTYPDIKGREAILGVHSRKKPLGPDVDLATIAKTTVGFTGADLENLLNEAALLAARKSAKAIVMKDIEAAAIKLLAGPEKRSRVVLEEERRLTAYHEAGHAIVSHCCETQDPVHQISIIPRGMMGGFTMNLPEHDVSYRRRRRLFENIVVLLGGRVAEAIVFNDISTGASNDLERATATARDMITKYGFSEKLGPVVYSSHDEVFLGRDFTQSRNYSESVAASIDAEVRGLIEEAYRQAHEILERERDKLELVAKALLEFENISGEQFQKLMAGEALPPAGEAQKAVPRRRISAKPKALPIAPQEAGDSSEEDPAPEGDIAPTE